MKATICMFGVVLASVLCLGPSCTLPPIGGSNAEPVISSPVVSGTLVQNQASTITVYCTATDSDGTIASVKANLSAVGGSATQTLTHASGTQWSWSGSVTPPTDGSKTVTIVATDNDGASGSGTTTVAVADSTGPGTGSVVVEVVAVGQPANVADTRYAATGFGSVGHEFSMGKYEVTAGQYCAFLSAVAGVDTYGLYDIRMWTDTCGCKIERYNGNGTVLIPYQYRVASDYANRPVNFVSWGEAARFVNWLHNGQKTGSQSASTTENGVYALNGAVTTDALLAVVRKSGWKWAIPTEDEWYKAAYYKGGSTIAGYWDYPTRSDSAPGRDLNDVTGNNANVNVGTIFYPVDSGKYYTTVGGEFQNSAGPYGTFDQGGNVTEWNETIVGGTARGQRGGSYDGYGYQINSLLASYRLYGNPTDKGLELGFRVCKAP